MTAALTPGDLAQRIPDGATVALGPDYAGAAVDIVRSLIERRARGLKLVCVPTGGFAVDVLIGAGAVAEIEAAAVSLGELGPAPRFVSALKQRTLVMRDATCPAIHAGLQAAEKGAPFMAMRGIIGSDLMGARPDWRIIDNPFAPNETSDKIVCVPAIRPDVAVFHAKRADVHGNVWIGVRRELMLMAHASRTTLVTVERIEDTDFLADPVMAAGTIPALYVGAIAVAANGAGPVGLPGAYPADTAALKTYAQAAKTDAGFAQWLIAFVGDKAVAATA